MTPDQWRTVAGNLGLVWWTINRMDLDKQARLDAWDAGLDGLMTAAVKFDPAAGYRFSTFARRAVFWSVVRQQRDATTRRRQGREVAAAMRMQYRAEYRDAVRTRGTAAEAGRLADRALAAMPEKAVKVVRLVYGFDGLGEMTAREVARLVGEHPTTVNARLRGGLGRARESLAG